MKKLTCEMCGSTDLIKDGGVFVCQSCGCKYSVEEAKKMMVEGVVEVTGTVKVDESGKVDTYLDMARHAYDASNMEECEAYCNRVIELNPRDYATWLLKGKAAGWQSKAMNDRIGEAVECFTKAVDYAPESEAKSVKEDVVESFEGLAVAMLNLKCQSYGRFPSPESAHEIVAWLQRALLHAVNLIVKCDAEPAEVRERMASIAAGAAEAAWSGTIYPEYNNEVHRTKFEWQQFVERGDGAIQLLLAAAALFDEGDAQAIRCYEKCIKINSIIKDSCSTTYEPHSGKYIPEYTLTASAKAARDDQDLEWRTKQREARDKKTEQVMKDREEKAEQAKRDCEEFERKTAEYWSGHADERAGLEAEIASARQELATANAELDSANGRLGAAREMREQKTPAAQASDELRGKLDALRGELSALGMFKNKEKKRIQGDIDAIERQLRELEPVAKEEAERQKADAAPLIDEARRAVDEAKTRVQEAAEKTRELEAKLENPLGLDLPPDSAVGGHVLRGKQVTFGSYPQSSETPEPIEWSVLDTDGDLSLVVSNLLLDYRPFNNSKGKGNRWETSDLKRWLEGEFTKRAFTEDERSMLNGLPFCLSIEQVEAYFEIDPDRCCDYSDYARKKALADEMKSLEEMKAFDDSHPSYFEPEFLEMNAKFYADWEARLAEGKAINSWWLSSSGDSELHTDPVAGVTALGEILTSGSDADSYSGVRVAAWVRI